MALWVRMIRRGCLLTTLLALEDLWDASRISLKWRRQAKNIKKRGSKCAFKAMAASSAPRESTRASSSKPCMVEEIEHQKCTWQDHCKPHQLLRDVVHRSPAAATMAIFASHQLEECGRHCLPPARSICSSRQPAPRSRHFQWNRHPHHSRDSRNEKKRSPYEIHFPFPNEPSFVSGKDSRKQRFLAVNRHCFPCVPPITHFFVTSLSFDQKYKYIYTGPRFPCLFIAHHPINHTIKPMPQPINHSIGTGNRRPLLLLYYHAPSGGPTTAS
jgi:hypothetical protein